MWPESVCWRHGQASTLDLPLTTAQDWSEFNAVSFWMHSEKATGSSFMALFFSENPETDGQDYYSHKITLDWTDWKQFVLPFNELRATRGPLGWSRITGVRFTASGFGNNPHPSAVLRLDGFELLGSSHAGQRMTDAELFASLDLDSPPLTALRQAAEAGDFPAARSALASYLRARTTPRWLFDWRQPAFRDAKTPPREVAAAERVLQHKFDYPEGPGKTGTATLGAKIAWAANPTEGEARTHLWNESLNRHFHFRTLAEAYWQAGLDKYAKEIADEILDWTASNPVVLISSGNAMPNGSEAWQTLTTGIRLADTWPNALYRCLASPAFSEDAIVALFKSVCEQARHLVRWPTRANWLTTESYGLFTAGMLFPEFKEAHEWRRLALERLFKQLDDEIYPDGMEYELAAGYNNWVVSQLTRVLELADLNDRRAEVPPDFLAKMEKMFDYLVYASMPNGQAPGLNDSNNVDVRAILATGFKLFPKRLDFEFIATAGQRGRTPAETSHAFAYAGHYVMRSGWDQDATYLLFDAGPFGAAHQHEDKLHFVLWSHGAQIVLDPGNFSYDRSRWRRYVLSTAAHNTILVDGQGQHREGKQETYFWPRPWTPPAPPNNDARWVSTPEYDLAIGSYTDGYGPKNDILVTHERRILFVKSENIFLVTDTLTPRADVEHRYEALFHLDAANALLDGSSRTVRTDNPSGSNLAIVALVDRGTTVEIVKGKEDEPVQGWAGQPWRAIPTAVYRTSGRGVVRLHFVLEPLAPGVQPVVRRVEKVAKDKTGLSVRVVFADEHGLEIVPSAKSDALALRRRTVAWSPDE